VACLATFALLSCRSSQRQEKERRKEGIEELDQLYATVHGLSILVSAGITKGEYSQRVEDTLLKLGDLRESIKKVAPKFGDTDQTAVAGVYIHLSKSVDAFTLARDQNCPVIEF
jgi:hypothetical protein